MDHGGHPAACRSQTDGFLGLPIPFPGHLNVPGYWSSSLSRLGAGWPWKPLASLELAPTP